jgi:hypothetical protein
MPFKFSFTRNLSLASKICILDADLLMEHKATFKRACFYLLCEEYYILRISVVEKKNPFKAFFSIILPVHQEG